MHTHLRQEPLPNPEGAGHLFRSRTMEVLILIPAASHLTANRPRTCWRSWLERDNKTTSSTKSRDEIQWLPNQTPSSLSLCLEIQSTKIMNRTGDKGQPCRSTTCTGNRSDLLPAMQTKLLLHSYRDHTALSRGTWSNAFSKRAPCGEYRTGPMFRGQDENRIVPPESEVRLLAEFSSPVPWSRLS